MAPIVPIFLRISHNVNILVWADLSHCWPEYKGQKIINSKLPLTSISQVAPEKPSQEEIQLLASELRGEKERN